MMHIIIILLESCEKQERQRDICGDSLIVSLEALWLRGLNTVAREIITRISTTNSIWHATYIFPYLNPGNLNSDRSNFTLVELNRAKKRTRRRSQNSIEKGIVQMAVLGRMALFTFGREKLGHQASYNI